MYVSGYKIVTNLIMNQSDIEYLVKLLKNATESRDWDGVEESLEYLQDYLESPLDEVDE